MRAVKSVWSLGSELVWTESRSTGGDWLQTYYDREKFDVPQPVGLWWKTILKDEQIHVCIMQNWNPALVLIRIWVFK
jgi:hypothetical protein